MCVTDTLNVYVLDQMCKEQIEMLDIKQCIYTISFTNGAKNLSFIVSLQKKEEKNQNKKRPLLKLEVNNKFNQDRPMKGEGI